MLPIELMIVEDDVMVLEVNRQFIERVEGIKIVGTAKTGAEAIKHIVEHVPSLVVLDFYLPDMTGLEVIKEVRKKEQDTDFILVTAAKDVDTIKQVFRFGAIDYIMKPFRARRLEEALERYKRMVYQLQSHRDQEWSQQELDHWQKTSIANENDQQLPKGLNEITLKQIFHYMLTVNSPLSADEVAQGTGLARVTVRRYLEYLERNNKLQLEIQYGSVGRPINKYSV